MYEQDYYARKRDKLIFHQIKLDFCKMIEAAKFIRISLIIKILFIRFVRV